MAQLSVLNFYEQVPKKKNKLETNPNFNLHHLNIPFRMLLVGSSGSMKTNTALNMLKAFDGTFEKVTVVCRNKDEPLYNLLSDSIPDDQLEMIEIAGNDMSKMPSMNGLNSDSPNSLVIFDDLCLVEDDGPICEFFIRARKCNISCMYLTQSYFEAPKTVRLNCDTIIFKKIGAMRDLKTILSEYTLGVEKEELLELYKQCTKTKLDWLMIITENEPGKQFFHNFEPLHVENTLNDSSDSDPSASAPNPAPVPPPPSPVPELGKKRKEFSERDKEVLLAHYKKMQRLNQI